jgi:hypothetical protein
VAPPGVAQDGCSSLEGVGHAVPEMAGWRVGGSIGGRKPSALPPVCHASVVERQPLVPVGDRHSVVVRQWAVSVVERHSAVSERQPTPSGGKLGRPVVATSDQRLTGSSQAGWSGGGTGRCDQASARTDQATASGMGCMLPVSVTDPQEGWSGPVESRHRGTVVDPPRSPNGSVAPVPGDGSGLSGLFEVDQASDARCSRGSLVP